MLKLWKVTILLYSTDNQDIEQGDIQYVLDQTTDDILFDILHMDSKKVENWHDGHYLNRTRSTDELEKYWNDIDKNTELTAKITEVEKKLQDLRDQQKELGI